MYGSIIFTAYHLYSMLTLLHVDKTSLFACTQSLLNFYELWNLMLLLHIKNFFGNLFYLSIVFYIGFYIWIKTNTITARTGQGE